MKGPSLRRTDIRTSRSLRARKFRSSGVLSFQEKVASCAARRPIHFRPDSGLLSYTDIVGRRYPSRRGSYRVLGAPDGMVETERRRAPRLLPPEDRVRNYRCLPLRRRVDAFPGRRLTENQGRAPTLLNADIETACLPTCILEPGFHSLRGGGFPGGPRLRGSIRRSRCRGHYRSPWRPGCRTIPTGLRVGRCEPHLWGRGLRD